MSKDKTKRIDAYTMQVRETSRRRLGMCQAELKCNENDEPGKRDTLSHGQVGVSSF